MRTIQYNPVARRKYSVRDQGCVSGIPLNQLKNSWFQSIIIDVCLDFQHIAYTIIPRMYTSVCMQLPSLQYFDLHDHLCITAVCIFFKVLYILEIIVNSLLFGHFLYKESLYTKQQDDIKYVPVLPTFCMQNPHDIGENYTHISAAVSEDAFFICFRLQQCLYVSNTLRFQLTLVVLQIILKNFCF